MVAQLLRLRADLLAGEVRGSARRSVLVVVGSLAGLAAAVLVAMAVTALRTADPEVARTVVVPVGTLVMVGFTIIPLAVGGADQFDPRRFAVFGVTRRDLAVGLGVAGLVGVPIVSVAIVAVAQSVTWMRDAGSGVLGVVAAVLVVATAALLVRVGCALGAWLFGGHRPTRDAGWLVTLVVVVLAIPTVSLLLRVDWVDPRSTELDRIADIAGWTPWGAAWAVPAAAAVGDTGGAVVELLIALAVLGLLAWAWWALVGHLLVTVDDRASVRSYRTLGWFDRLGATPVGAVAARALTYWGRDPRYRTSYLILLFVPIVVVPLGVAGMPWHWTALIPLPLMAVIAGFLPHNDVAYDNTAVWLHVASGAPGWSDRLGRLTPVIVVGVPVIVAGSGVSAWLFGDAAAFPVLIGVCVGALFAGLGISSVVSVALPYPTVRPGDRAFQQPQAAGVVSTVSQSVTIIGILVFSVPAGWLAVLAFADSAATWAMLTLLVGAGVGVVVLGLGVVVGGKLFDRHGPDLLAAAQRN
ncbi:ABC transporter permease [Microbacterium sp. M1A1_1b]